MPCKTCKHAGRAFKENHVCCCYFTDIFFQHGEAALIDELCENLPKDINVFTGWAKPGHTVDSTSREGIMKNSCIIMHEDSYCFVNLRYEQEEFEVI